MIKKTLILLAAFGTATSVFAQADTVITSPSGSFTIGANTFNQASGSSLNGASNFNAVGILGDFATRSSFMYRQTGDTRERAISSATASFSSTPNSWTAVIQRAVNNTGNATLEFTLTHSISNATATSPLLISTVNVRNLDTVARGVTLFHYNDWDVPASATETANTGNFDTIASNVVDASGIRTRLADQASGYFVETFAQGATRYQHGATYVPLFTNTVINNLNNTITPGTSLAAAGIFEDCVVGMQWDEITLGVGQSYSYTMMSAINATAAPVPEPATLSVLGIGAVVAFLRRKK